MLLNLKHKSLAVYQTSRELVKEAYKITLLLPQEEKFNMVQQIRRAALSVKLNLAEGASRRSIAERRRYYEISRGSIVEIDAALEAAVDLEYFSIDRLQNVDTVLNKCFAMFSKMIDKE